MQAFYAFPPGALAPRYAPYKKLILNAAAPPSFAGYGNMRQRLAGTHRRLKTVAARNFKLALGAASFFDPDGLRKYFRFIRTLVFLGP